MCKIFSSQKGMSIIAAIFALIILGIFGMAIVALVSAEHESRANHSSSVVSFYDAQAGFEYAIREIKDGWYPLVTNKVLSRGDFTTAIAYSETSTSYIYVVGKVGAVQKRYQISYTPFEADCTSINTSGVALGGTGNIDVTGITFRRTCNNAINVDKIILSWTTNGGEKVMSISMNGEQVWQSPTGAVSGTTIDINDSRFTDTSSHPLTLLRFSSSMSHKNVTMRFIMTDSSTETVTFTLP